jgi:hypothetical protein
MATLVSSFTFLGIPLVRIHFRDDSRVPSIVIFILAILSITIPWALQGINVYLGSFAFVVSFIMALACPNKDYWEKSEINSHYGFEAHKKETVKQLIVTLAALITVTAVIFFIIIYRQTGSFFKFQQNEQGTITITGYSGKKEVVIPETYHNVSVTEIGDKVFYQQKIISVSIPDSITGIGESAFSGCAKLSEVIIPDGVTSIGNQTFYECSNLSSVNIPNSVINIGNQVFYGCGNLSSVTIPDSVYDDANYSIIDGILYSKEEPEFIILPKSLTIKGKVTIPNGVTRIESESFSGCTDLTGVTIPDSVTFIGQRAFSDCTKLASVNIPDSVTSIGEDTFRSCYILASVTIPNSVTFIGVNAFRNCGIARVTIGNGVTRIAQLAFCECNNLTSVTIPASVNSIERLAFSGCKNLTSVTFQGKIGNLDDTAFGPSQFGKNFGN